MSGGCNDAVVVVGGGETATNECRTVEPPKNLQRGH